MDKTGSLPQVDEARCTLCGLCVEVCPCHSVELGERGPAFNCPDSCPDPTCSMALYHSCLSEEVCPSGAISYPFEIVLEGEGWEGANAYASELGDVDR
jgi:Fe-S-cluster-containing hydrogenase component 2